MALTPAEEFELLSLEREKSAPQPRTDEQSQGIGHYLLSKDIQSNGADPLGKIAKLGQFAASGNQMIGRGATDILSKAGASPYLAAIPETITHTASEFLLPQNRLGAAATAAAPLIRGAMGIYGGIKGAYNELANGVSDLANNTTESSNIASKATKPGFIAGMGQGMARLRPGDTQYYLDHPDEIMNAKTLDQAEAGYKNAIGDLKGKTKSIGERLNKRQLGAADYREAIDRADRLVRGTELDSSGNVIPITPQDALEGVQSITGAMKNREYTATMDKERAAALGAIKADLMDYMQNNGTPKLREAAKELFKAHVKDSFSKWLPQNKYGSTDALRTWLTSAGLLGSIGEAGKLAMTGNPMAALPVLGSAAIGASIISPKMWGIGINNISRLGQTSIQNAAASIATAAANKISDYYKSPPLSDQR